MKQSRLRLLACTILFGVTLAAVGCSPPQQGASFEARLLRKNADGELEESVRTTHSHFVVNGKGNIGIDRRKLAWEVTAVDSNKVTVAVTFAGSDPQEVQIDVGKSEDVLFDNGSIGVRILIHGIKVK